MPCARKYLKQASCRNFEHHKDRGRIRPGTTPANRHSAGNRCWSDGENDAPIGSDTGFARLIVPGDKFGGRDALDNLYQSAFGSSPGWSHRGQ